MCACTREQSKYIYVYVYMCVYVCVVLYIVVYVFFICPVCKESSVCGTMYGSVYHAWYYVVVGGVYVRYDDLF